MRRRIPAPVVIVGGGIAGLSCALHLQRLGIRVRLLERDREVGGRVRSERRDGFLLDRGFQVLLTAYPEARRLLDYTSLLLGRFLPGALVRTAGGFERIVDPFRRPQEGLNTLFSGVGTLSDKLRVARMRQRLCAAPLEELLRRPSRSSLEALRGQGFSPRMIETFFRPFLGGIFLDPTLATSSRFLSFAFRMFSLGDAALPAQGMGAIPAHLARRLAPGTLRTGAAVEALERDGVLLATGERVPARAVVVATEPSTAAKLLPELEVPGTNPVTCLYFDAAQAPPVGRLLVLNGTGRGPVNNLCVPSEIAPSYAPAGRALVSATVLGTGVAGPGLEADVRAQLREWFGVAVDGWRLLSVVPIPDALPRQEPGPFEPEARPVRLAERLFVCGDHRDVASLNGAMAAGRRAAEAVHAELRS